MMHHAAIRKGTMPFDREPAKFSMRPTSTSRRSTVAASVTTGRALRYAGGSARDPLHQPLGHCLIDALTDLFIMRGPPEFIRSDNGVEFIARKVRGWIEAVGVKTAFIEPGSPWENGYCESFNARFRDELLNAEVFYSLREAQILIERWRRHYNTVRPHSAPGYRPPAPEAFVPMDQRPTMH
jgi:transposase InsO family protein